MTRRPDGAVWYTYTAPDGVVGRQVVPPPNFDPSAATVAQLKHYLYPLDWIHEISAAQLHPDAATNTAASRARVDLATFHTRDIGANSRPEFINSPYGSSATDIWGGEVSPPLGQPGYVPYAFVVGYFTQSAFQFECTNEPTYSAEATWTGLGGYGGPPLLQSGTLTLPGEPGPPYTPYAFLEGIPSSFDPPSNTNQIEMVGPAATPYDDIAAGTEWDYSPGSSTGTWFAGVTDESSPNGLNWYMEFTKLRSLYGPGTGPGGATEEAIDERPTSRISGTSDYIYNSLLEPDFNAFQWNSVYGEEYPDGQGPFVTYPDSLNFLALNMWSSNNTHYLDSGADQPLNTGVGASGDGFLDYWDTCGPTQLVPTSGS